MKHILLALLLATLCATSYGQTIKALGYNTNFVVVYGATNALRFTNVPDFDNGATFAGGDLQIDSVGVINWGGLPKYEPESQYFYGAVYFEDAAGTRTNLGLGATNNVSFSDIQINEFGEDPVFVKNEVGFLQFVVNTNIAFTFSDSIGSFNFPVEFNNATNAAITRTNLGISWTGLTNTNAATFQGALFSATNAAPTNTNAPTPDAWVDIQVGTNTYKLPLWQ